MVLAAGAGKRMHSDLPKVMHPVLGVPMVLRVIRTARSCGFDRIVAVVGHGRHLLAPLLEAEGVEAAVQERQLGTAHAVSCALPMADADEVTVLLGDVPLLTASTIGRLTGDRAGSGAAVGVLSAIAPDPRGYGRIVRGGPWVERIVEDRDCTEEQAGIPEVNTGLMSFDGSVLPSLLAGIGRENSQGEYYLTDAIGLASGAGMRVSATVARTWEEVAGVNDPFQLASASRSLSRRNVRRLLEAGATFPDPDTVWVEDGVELGPGTVVGRNARLSGSTRAGAGCLIGDGAVLIDAVLPDGSEVRPYSVLEG